MHTRPLGRTGIHVSAFTLGTMMFGPYGNPDRDECVRIVVEVIGLGRKRMGVQIAGLPKALRIGGAPEVVHGVGAEQTKIENPPKLIPELFEPKSSRRLAPSPSSAPAPSRSRSPSHPAPPG